MKYDTVIASWPEEDQVVAELLVDETHVATVIDRGNRYVLRLQVLEQPLDVDPSAFGELIQTGVRRLAEPRDRG